MARAPILDFCISMRASCIKLPRVGSVRRAGLRSSGWAEGGERSEPRRAQTQTAAPTATPQTLAKGARRALLGSGKESALRLAAGVRLVCVRPAAVWVGVWLWAELLFGGVCGDIKEPPRLVPQSRAALRVFWLCLVFWVGVSVLVLG